MSEQAQEQETGAKTEIKSEQVAQIVELIKGLSLLEAVELKNALEEEFGVTAMPAMMAGPMMGGEEATKEEEKTHFDLELSAYEGDKIKVIKCVRTMTTLGLKEAKALVESLPKIVREGVEKEEAEKLKAQLEEVGGKVELK